MLSTWSPTTFVSFGEETRCTVGQESHPQEVMSNTTILQKKEKY